MARFQRLSAAQMDSARDQAETALNSLPRDVVKTMADWWSQWYLSAGHRRLGRLLLSRKSPPRPGARKRETGEFIQRSTLPEPKAHIVEEGVIYTLSTAHLDSAAFFEVKETGAEICVVLNSSHPAYKAIEQALTVTERTRDGSKPLLREDAGAVALLLRAWSDVERRSPDGERKRRLQEAREDWGRIARDLLVGDSG